MPVRIHQLLAIINSVNVETDSAFGQLGQVVGSPELFKGMKKTSRAAGESTDPNAPKRRVTPEKVTKVRYTAAQVLDDTQKLFTAKWDTALTLDTAQATAIASVVVDGAT